MHDHLVHPLPHWWDLSDPTPEVLRGIADRFGLHQSSVQDCLDPEHFPKIERVGDTLFMIIRCFDSAAPSDADDLLGLTRKIAFFLTKDNLITIHRADQPFIKEIRERVQANQTPFEITVRLMKKSVESFIPYLEKLEQQIEVLERELMVRSQQGELLALYGLRAKLNVVKRLSMHANGPSPWLTDLRESSEELWRYCDELMDDVQNLLALHLALSSHRTNEIMRFLTVVSLFFFPLTFIVGVYGMNFKFMPELEWRFGYPAVWVVMIVVSILIYWKVRAKGWLTRE